jgi:tRNA threonylcarbamoyladenosine biosynthesis protein TsaB
LRVLAIETSGRLGAVALVDTASNGPDAVLERTTPEGQRTAQSLLPTIQQLLQERSWRPTDVELVCVTTGPGSFTGLRIGIVAAKTFAYATGAKLAGVHTLAAIARGVKQFCGDIIPMRLWTILDAQRQELFAAEFDLGRPIVEQAQPATEIVGIDDWASRLTAGDAVAGPPLSKLQDRLPAEVASLPPQLWQPTAESVGRLAIQLFQLGAQVHPLELVPHYFRKSAAEEKAARQAEQ